MGRVTSLLLSFKFCRAGSYPEEFPRSSDTPAAGGKRRGASILNERDVRRSRRESGTEERPRDQSLLRSAVHS